MKKKQILVPDILQTVITFINTQSSKLKIVAAFRGMQVSPAKHSSVLVTDGQTDRQTDRRTDRQATDKVIPMCRYDSQATQKS